MWDLMKICIQTGLNIRWFNGKKFLLQPGSEPQSPANMPTVLPTVISRQTESVKLEILSYYLSNGIVFLSTWTVDITVSLESVGLNKRKVYLDDAVDTTPVCRTGDFSSNIGLGKNCFSLSNNINFHKNSSTASIRLKVNTWAI